MKQKLIKLFIVLASTAAILFVPIPLVRWLLVREENTTVNEKELLSQYLISAVCIAAPILAIGLVIFIIMRVAKWITRI